LEKANLALMLGIKTIETKIILNEDIGKVPFTAKGTKKSQGT